MRRPPPPQTLDHSVLKRGIKRLRWLQLKRLHRSERLRTGEVGRQREANLRRTGAAATERKRRSEPIHKRRPSPHASTPRRASTPLLHPHLYTPTRTECANSCSSTPPAHIRTSCRGEPRPRSLAGPPCRIVDWSTWEVQHGRSSLRTREGGERGADGIECEGGRGGQGREGRGATGKDRTGC